MEFKGSKGKWELRKDSLIFSIQTNEFIANSCTLITRVCDERLNGESWLEMRKRTEPERIACHKEKLANAQLIATAPELLDALIILTEGTTIPEGWKRDLALKAIKKATEIKI